MPTMPTDDALVNMTAYLDSTRGEVRLAAELVELLAPYILETPIAGCPEEVENLGLDAFLAAVEDCGYVDKMPRAMRLQLSTWFTSAPASTHR